jgi:hypothetical protein
MAKNTLGKKRPMTLKQVKWEASKPLKKSGKAAPSNAPN